ncbi:Zinc finger, PHD-type [Corchorus olitorius]|uniref:Zinc finger, PHD-type n=1 Tax=Corchorus olitorius TaxID=93759 RepID=A0A1R3GAP5_9ROSI|nr:Zinc finger, PHD-type [Corchorus olitorius]
MEGGKKVMDHLLQHCRHEHPLEFVQDHEEGNLCDCCGKRVEGPSYCCSQCKFYLHKKCAKLELAPEINHFFHPKHPLTLVESSDRSYVCDFCRRIDVSRFAYRCDSCDFDLDVNCALLQISSAENFPNSLHDHPVFLIKNHNKEVKDSCKKCVKPLSGPIYKCLELDCHWFNLHKRCAGLDLAPEINHPILHPKHPLTLFSDPPLSGYQCHFCGRNWTFGFVYHCDSCNFNLDVNCALFQISSTENFPNCLHDHPMIFIKNHKDELIEYDCIGCKQPLSGPIYKCLDCDQFYFHQKCGDLPLQINHPCDRAHPLSLIRRNPTAHQEECNCSLCKIEWDGFVYCCSICDIELTPEDVSAPSTIIAPGDENLWTLVSCQISFICDFCGVNGDRTPYICTRGDFILHKDCISMPKAIKIARHPHPISHVYSVQQIQVEELYCRICHENVNARYGCYCCSAFDNCNYIAHVKCATDKDIWDGTVVLEDDIEMWKVGLGNESKNMITHVISEVRVGEDIMATKIKHAFHPHNLILNFTGEVGDDYICDGCVLPISSTPFYNCQQCKFCLHKSCAELPREKGVPAHKHMLKLTNNDNWFQCHACSMYRDGFSYKCYRWGCGGFMIDVQCSLLPDTLRHPSHEHSLFLSHNYEGQKWLAYRCTKRCDFAIVNFIVIIVRKNEIQSPGSTPVHIVIILYIKNVLLGHSHSSSLGAHATFRFCMDTPSLLLTTFGTVLDVIYVVNFAIDRLLNVKNLGATLRSIGIAYKSWVHCTYS